MSTKQSFSDAEKYWSGKLAEARFNNTKLVSELTDLRAQLAERDAQIYNLVQNAQRFVTWYRAQPDGPLPKGMNNGMFFNLEEVIQATRQPTQDKAG